MKVPGSQRSWCEGSVPSGLLISLKGALEEYGMIDRQAGAQASSRVGVLLPGGLSWIA